MRQRSFVLGGLCLLVCLGAHATQITPSAATVPMQLELDRPYIDVTLAGPDQKPVHAHAWVDTGGGAILLSARLARTLGLKATGKAIQAEGHSLAPATAPALRIDGKLIDLTDARVLIATDQMQTLDNTDADMALPARMLRKYIVVFDYPAHTFTVAKAGQSHSAGTPVSAYIGESGMPVVWLSVAGHSHGFLLDTGGQFCMVSSTNVHDWIKQKPAWKHVAGTYGPGNMLLPHEDKLEMMQVGEMAWGPFRIENAGVVSRPPGNYEKWMSGMLGKPIIGSIGGNVLRDFRVSIDYPAGKVYLQRKSSTPSPELVAVGVTLGTSSHGGYDIVGVAAGVRDLHAGDHLLTIDGHDVSALPYYRVAALLSGKPEQTRTLGLTRSGKPLTVEATVHNVFRADDKGFPSVSRPSR